MRYSCLEIALSDFEVCFLREERSQSDLDGKISASNPLKTFQDNENKFENLNNQEELDGLSSKLQGRKEIFLVRFYLFKRFPIYTIALIYKLNNNNSTRRIEETKALKSCGLNF